MESLYELWQDAGDLQEVREKTETFFGQARRKDLVVDLVEKIVDPREAYRAYEQVCVLRQVNVPVLSRYSSKLHIPLENAREWLGELQRKGIIQKPQRSLNTVYEVDEVIGPLVTNYLYYQQPDRFVELQNAAYEAFHQLANTGAGWWRLTALNEMIYHYVLSRSVRSDGRNKNLIEDLLEMTREQLARLPQDVPDESPDMWRDEIIEHLSKELDGDVVLQWHVNRITRFADQSYNDLLEGVRSSFPDGFP
jgi:hypothetical protein